MNPTSATANPAALFAALSGPFAPEHALQRLSATDNMQQLVLAASHLADSCDISPAGVSNRWVMRTSVRHSLLLSLDANQLDVEVAARRSLDPDPETVDLLGALTNQAPLQRDAIQAIVQAADDPAQLERVIVALDRAGELAPARDLLPLARFALSEFHRGTRRQLVAERGFFGREDELTAIEKWLERPISNAPVACLFIAGAPGIGKSSLLAEAVRRYYQRHRPLLLRLDFDRAGLDVRDLLGLTQEAARQLAEQLGEAGSDLLQARLEAGLVEERESSRQTNLRQQFPARLADIIGSAVGASKRIVLVVLDTLEVLRGRGDTHPASLFQWLDSLIRHGAKPMAVLAAGRGDALESLREVEARLIDKPSPEQLRVSRLKVLAMDRLEEPAARALLERLHVPEEDRLELLEIGAGSPLRLRLAAEVVRRTDLKQFRKRKRGIEVSEAFLYRMLLSRIEDPTLQALAHPGLIVRRINAEVIEQVLAPALGLKLPSPEYGKTLMDQLASHHWLVEPDPGAAGFLKHRSDMRRLLLPLLYQSAPARSAKVDAAAVRWFGARPERWAQVEAVYHQLQLTRNGRRVPTVSAQLAAQFDADALDELPPRAADIVRRSRGQRTNLFRDSMQLEELEQDDQLLQEELLSLIRRQDWQEGMLIIRNVVQQGGVDPRSPSADAIRTFLWRSGQWAEARRWLNERDQFDVSDTDLLGLPEPVALARLEMRAEFAPDMLWRSRLRWQPVLEQLYRNGENAKSSDARLGALALIFHSIPDFALPRPISSRDIDYLDNSVVATLEYWGEDSDNGTVPAALDWAKRRMADTGIINTGLTHDMPAGSVLASLTPYAGYLTSHTVTRPRHDVTQWAQTAVTIISNDGWKLHPGLRFDRSRDTDPIVWLGNVGLFAEWLQVTTFVHPDRDLSLIGRSAERWRRTMAGDWSIGRRRGQWRGRPQLDETLAERLRMLLAASQPAEMAREHIDTWGAIASSTSLDELLLRRLRNALGEAQCAIASGIPLDQITRRLLTRGAPAAVAPALAVLVAHRAI